MKKLDDFDGSASASLAWHPGPGCRYKFEKEPMPVGFSVHWDGYPPPLAETAFWKQYVKHRDSFVSNLVPIGRQTILGCAFSRTIRVIEGRAAK